MLPTFILWSRISFVRERKLQIQSTGTIYAAYPHHVPEKSEEELKFAAREIVRLTRENGYRYRDIAVVTGDVQQYGNYVPEIFEQYHIPYFIDQTKIFCSTRLSSASGRS